MSQQVNQRELDIVGDYVWDADFARAVDHSSTESIGIPSRVLMEMAGRGVADAILDLDVDAADGTPIIVLAGPGNNGGDALVAARWLAEAGCEVHTYLVSETTDAKLSPLADAQLKCLRAAGYAVENYRRGALGRFKRAEPIIVDGVLGLGISRSLDPKGLIFAALAEAATLGNRTTIAVDIPSGLDANNGAMQQIPLRADLTVTFGGKKIAHVIAPARDACGEVMVIDIGFPSAAVSSVAAKEPPPFIVPDGRELILRNPWADLKRSAHKYDRGHVLVIGGSPGKTGAPLLAAMSALRCGAGWVTVAMPESALASLRGDVPRELVFENLFIGEELNSLALAKFLTERRVRAVVIGPGCMTSPLTAAVVAELAAFTSAGDNLVVLDAGAVHGALPLLTGADLDSRSWLLTPHPGEWQQLSKTPPPAPLTSAALKDTRVIAESIGVTMLYKHATPIVVTGDQKLPAFVLTEGGVALARAGSGDLLAGAAAAHGAIGVSATLSVLRAQTVIAWAARLAADKRGEHAVLAQDILAHIGQVVHAAEAAVDADEDDD